MNQAFSLDKARNSENQQAFFRLSAELLAYSTALQSLATPEAVLDDLHQITNPAIKLNLFGAWHLPVRACDWDALHLGKTVFLHKSAPKGYWEEWRQRAPNHNPAVYFQSRLSLAPVTVSEMLRILAPIGADRWGFELALKYGIRDEFICPVGGRWLVIFWSQRVLTNVLTEPLRIMVFAAASFAAMRIEQLIETQAERDSAYTRLTPRELTVIRLLASGKSIDEISEWLGLGKETIRTHLKKVKVKLGAQTLAQVVALAMRQRLIL